MDAKEMKVYSDVLEYICLELSEILRNISLKYQIDIEEIRLRNGKPINIYLKGKDYFINRDGDLVKDLDNAVLINKEHINKTFQLISNYSVYAFEEEIKNGFITLKGGHRVGIGGKILYGDKGIENIRNISSLNIRIAREKIGTSNKVIKYILNYPYTIHNTLIISPPQCGKTTLLRDLIRDLSNGSPLTNGRGFKIGVIDERSELAGMHNGISQHDTGLRTDVLDGCNKKDGTMMLLRSMSPDIIAMDEIGSKSDIKSIHEILKAGVKVIATVHGDNLEDLISKRSLNQLVDERIFKRYIFLDNSKGVGTIRDIIEGNSLSSILK